MLHRLGRRGGFLTAFGAAWLVIGLGLVTAPAQVPPATLMHVGLHIWGGVWICCAVIALAAAWFPHQSKADMVGFLALMLPDAVWLGGHLTRWLDDPSSRAWLAAAVWAAIFAAIFVGAGWREPTSMHDLACEVKRRHERQ